MGRDHTLFSLVTGHVKFTREPRMQGPPQKGRKWLKRAVRKFANVVEVPQTQTFILTDVLHPNRQQPRV